MPLYKITITKKLFVEADDEEQAENEAFERVETIDTDVTVEEVPDAERPRFTI